MQCTVFGARNFQTVGRDTVVIGQMSSFHLPTHYAQLTLSHFRSKKMIPSPRHVITFSRPIHQHRWSLHWPKRQHRPVPPMRVPPRVLWCRLNIRCEYVLLKKEKKKKVPSLHFSAATYSRQPFCGTDRRRLADSFRRCDFHSGVWRQMELVVHIACCKSCLAFVFTSPRSWIKTQHSYTPIRSGKKRNYEISFERPWFTFKPLFCVPFQFFLLNQLVELKLKTHTRYYYIENVALGHWEVLVTSQKLANVILTQEWRPYFIIQNSHTQMVLIYCVHEPGIVMITRNTKWLSLLWVTNLCSLLLVTMSINVERKPNISHKH